jgi:hypothetical protein
VTSASPYVAGALVSGASAHVLDRLLRSPDVRRVVECLPAWLRAEVEATVTAIRRAAVDYEALPVSPERSGETLPGETEPRWPGDLLEPGGLTVMQAADLLGVSARRAQQLAAGGMGRRVGRVWELDPTSVREYGQRRRAV